jgi:hypothetical protein
MSDYFICPCCSSSIGIEDNGDLYVMSQLSKVGVKSFHSGDPRFYQYLPSSTPEPAAEPSAPPLKLDDSGELLVDDATAALVHRALVKDLFERGIIPTTDLQ